MRLNSRLAHPCEKPRLLTGKARPKTLVWVVTTLVFDPLENGYV